MLRIRYTAWDGTQRVRLTSDRVFDRFWRADLARSRTGDRAGIGLGLSIARWIAEAHGGLIAVTSRPGRGSVFTVTLPVRREPPSGAPQQALSGQWVNSDSQLGGKLSEKRPVV